MTCGIYKITNKINGKAYIEKSTNVEKRMQRHTFPSEHRRFPNKTLYKAMNKYGTDNFSFEIIEADVPENILGEREKYWISYFDAKNFGYNETEGGDGGKTCNSRKIIGKLTEEEVREIRQAYASCSITPNECYQKYKDKITKRGFTAIWNGENSLDIMPEVFTEENRKKNTLLARQKEEVQRRRLSLEEIQELRRREQSGESLYKIYEQEYKTLYKSYTGFTETVRSRHPDE